jgi:6-phosphogluconolactonase
MIEQVGGLAPAVDLSYLAVHPSAQSLYAVGGKGAGLVYAWRWSDGGLQPLADDAIPSASGGDLPCHALVHPSGEWLFVANYSSGTVAALAIARDGRLGDAVVTDLPEGSGPVEDRQEASHPHQLQVSPDGRHVVVADLGTDSVLSYRFDPGTASMSLAWRNAMVGGSGPRHICFGPDNRAYLSNELSSSLSTARYHPNTGQLEIGEGIAATMTEMVARSSFDATPPSGTLINYPSDIQIGPTGNHVYIANRNARTISVFALDAGPTRLVNEIPAAGSWPMSLCFVGNHLYVANRDSDTMNVFLVDQQTGVPRVIATIASKSRPVCVVGNFPT